MGWRPSLVRRHTTGRPWSDPQSDPVADLREYAEADARQMGGDMGVHIDEHGHVTVTPDPDEADEHVIHESMAFVAGTDVGEATIASKMRSEAYHEGYWERGEGSNYVSYGDDPGWPVTVAVLRRAVDVDAKMLEIASAKGYFVLHARRAGFECWGVDLSEYAVSKVPDEVKQYVWHGNAVDLPYEDDQFDVTVSWEFAEHVPGEEIDRVLDEIERVTVPGGLVVQRIGITIDGEDTSQQQEDVTHVLEMPRDWWEARFAARRWTPVPHIEEMFDRAFTGRDWEGRYFAWQLPPTG